MYALILANAVLFLSTLSLRRATRKSQRSGAGIGISIHALLAESDATLLPTDGLFFLFLSTLSLRRATIHQSRDVSHQTEHFYPRSPCGERPRKSQRSGAGIGISIHALLAESDKRCQASDMPTKRISIHALLAESDPPLTSRTKAIPAISIHALLAESDHTL